MCNLSIRYYYSYPPYNTAYMYMVLQNYIDMCRIYTSMDQDINLPGVVQTSRVSHGVFFVIFKTIYIVLYRHSYI